jgi:hypothetical protein
MTLAVAAEIVIVATGEATVRSALPLRPSLVAVSVAEPAARALITAVDETTATRVSELFQVIVRPVRVRPAASRRVACRLSRDPGARESVDRLRASDATGIRTVRVARPVFPSAAAERVAEPMRSAVASPSATRTTVVSELVQLIGRPAKGAPSASRAVATS